MAAVRLLPLFFFLILLFLPPLSLSVSDDLALLEFKDSLTNTAALDSTWVKGTMPCDNNNPWIGIICNANSVQGLRLQGLRLSGDIDVASLLELENLRGLLIANNNFSGPIPPFNKLGALKALFIHGNQFSGEIPSDYFVPMKSLKKVWLSDNKFTGKIPDSLGQLDTLMELRLDHNEFSGPVPLIDQTSLKELNLAFNQLEGPIPETMSRFGAKTFEGNQQVCGTAVNKDCNKADALPNIEQGGGGGDGGGGGGGGGAVNDSEGSTSLKWVIMGIVVTLLLMTLLCKARQQEEHFDLLVKENLDEAAVPVRMPSSFKRDASSRRGNESFHSRSRKGGSSQHGGGKSTTDLVMVNDEKGSFGLQDLMKAAAEVLGNGGLGSAYKAHMGNGLSVVVKRFREMNKLSKESFDAEVRRLGKLKHQNILPPLAYHYRKEEKLLVSEFVPKGSLLYLLHGDRGTSHAELGWPIRLKIIQGVARGMGFLHYEFGTYELPHGNLKSCNILISADNEPLLTDYALYPLINSTPTVQNLFAYKSPEAILYQQLSPKSDVYCLGIIILEVLTGKFPSQYLNNQKGGTDLVQWVRSAIAEKRETELIDPEIVASAPDSLPQMEALLHIGAACTESECDKRIDMKEALRRIEGIQQA